MIYDELDSLRDRIRMLENLRDYVLKTAKEATEVTRTAERTVATTRTEWREALTRLESGSGQILDLLTSHVEACEPARRPENTQSASDKPLT
jgi:hypothetical protein